MRHWYYGGPDQIRTDFGHLLTGYERSVHPFPDSIMQLSNTGGGGRGSDEGDVVGGVILHDKKPYWRRGGQFHYHQTLDAGENTLEAVLAREMIRSLTSTGGRFSAEDFRQRYIDLMTTPGTHNDTYASTCHRMFFKKWRSGVAPEKCPDNDGHNVDTGWFGPAKRGCTGCLGSRREPRRCCQARKRGTGSDACFESGSARI